MIEVENCRIGTALHPIIKNLSLCIAPGEAILVSGLPGSGKSALGAALCGLLELYPAENGRYRNDWQDSSCMVSFEEAVHLIQHELDNDDSEFVDGGVDEGTLLGVWLFKDMLKGSQQDEENKKIIEACGLSALLERGLKRLSTGETRKAVLAHALLKRPALIVLDEPFDGLDTHARQALTDILRSVAQERALKKDGALLVLTNREETIPQELDRLIYLENRSIRYTGSRADWKPDSQKEISAAADSASAQQDPAFFHLLEPSTIPSDSSEYTELEELLAFSDVTVAWGDTVVFSGLNWTVRRGEHWLIQGPNGSGKTSLLELITGDNPQVFKNDIRIFGKRRGSGESIWDIKARLGMVSWRLHLDYRNLSDTSLSEVLVSGLHDSIGLYSHPNELEQSRAHDFLSCFGFAGRDSEHFGELSYGEQRMLLVLRAAIKTPDVLILDEPCHGLDAARREKILELIQRLAESGASTLLHVTHDPEEVLHCERNILRLGWNGTQSWCTIKR